MLRQRDEAGRRDEPILGVLPAGERLHADPLTVFKAHLGLIPGQQLVLLQGPAQLIQTQAVAVLLLAARLLGLPGADQLGYLLMTGGFVDAPQHLQAVGAAHAQHGVDHIVFQRAAQHYAAAKATQGEATQQGHAIHARHPQIAEQDVDLMVLTLGQRLLSVLGFQQVAVAKPADLVHQGLALEVVILHHHDHQLMPCTIHRAITPFHL
ncbi:hypothetical protein D3C84_305080 [compost metagenome]